METIINEKIESYKTLRRENRPPECWYEIYSHFSGNLTFDHILPKSLGGVTSWENVVSACLSCNFKKGAKSLKQVAFKLRTTPKKPLAEELQNMGRKFPPNYLHKSWLDFLYWDEILEI